MNAFGQIRQPCDDSPPQEDTPYLEQALWNNQNIARTKGDIAVDVAISDQAVEMDRIGVLLTLGGTDEHGVVPSRISGETTDGDHRIEHRHVRTIGKRTGLGSLTDDADLVGNRTTEACDNDRDERFFDIFAEKLFVFASEGGRCLTDRDDILDQRDRETTVGPHWDRERQLRVAPYKDVQGVAGTDTI